MHDPTYQIYLTPIPGTEDEYDFAGGNVASFWFALQVNNSTYHTIYIQCFKSKQFFASTLSKKS